MNKPSPILPPDEDVITFDEMYKRILVAAIERTKTPKEAYTLMGISERTFYRWLKMYKLYGVYRSRPANAA